MVQDPWTERLLQEVELVRSRGDPARKRLCVMSLVAFLAGEAHSDRPAAASPLIAAFARPVNDAMDRATRQRLVPFAPRILGTSAADDPARREALHDELMHRLLPAAVTDLQAGARNQAEARAAELTAVLAAELAAAPGERQPALVQDEQWDHAALIGPLRVAVTAYHNGEAVQQSEAVARLLIAAVSCLARPSRRNWYWGRAIGLLDRLCEAGREEEWTAAPVEGAGRRRPGVAA